MKSYLLSSVAIFAAALLAPLPAAARQDVPQSPAAAPDDSAERLGARVDAYFASIAADRDFSGIVRIERGGKLVVARRYGFADWEKRTPLTEDTLFSAASVTKSIVAVLLLQLEDEGVLLLSQRLAAHLPALEGITDATLLDVLKHRAGLPRDLPGEVDVTVPDAAATWLAEHPDRIGAEGTESYSNLGYALLAEAIEHAAGGTFAEIALARVLAPVGMTHSMISPDIAARQANGAKPYIAGPAPDGVETPIPAPLEIGSSGLLTTAADLARWGRALGQNRWPRLFESEDPLGSLNAGSEGGELWIGAQGSLPGYVAGTTYWPDTDVSITYIGNLFGRGTIGVGRVLRAIVTGGGAVPTLPPRRADVTLSEAHRTLGGRYRHPDFGRIEIAPDPSGRGMRVRMLDMEAYWSFYATPVDGPALHWRTFDTLIRRRADGVVEAVETRPMRDPRSVMLEPIAD